MPSQLDDARAGVAANRNRIPAREVAEWVNDGAGILSMVCPLRGFE